MLTFFIINDTFFTMMKMKIKTKNLESSWITKGIKKSSKKNQCVYSKLKKEKRIEKTKKISRLQKAF